MNPRNFVRVKLFSILTSAAPPKGLPLALLSASPDYKKAVGTLSVSRPRYEASDLLHIQFYSLFIYERILPWNNKYAIRSDVTMMLF